MDTAQMAPVAEYQGVAIIEIAGDKRAVWEGIEYTTDGNCYILNKTRVDGDPNGDLKMLQVQHEAAAKELIDQLSPEQRAKYCGLIEAFQIANASASEIQKQRERLERGKFVWDEAAGHFVYEEHLRGTGEAVYANPPYQN